MNTIFLTVPVTESTDTKYDYENFKEKVQDFLKDEKVRSTLQVISIVAPIVAGPMASSTSKVLPVIAKGLKHTPQAVNCILTLVQI